MSKGYDFLGEKLRNIRVLCGYTQSEIGKELNLPKQSISRIEKDKRSISQKELDILAKLYKLPTNFIFNDILLHNVYEVNRPYYRWGKDFPLETEKFVEAMEDLLMCIPPSNIKFANEIVNSTIKAFKELLKEYKERTNWKQ